MYIIGFKINEKLHYYFIHKKYKLKIKKIKTKEKITSSANS
jgi:hypothetical protein